MKTTLKGLRQTKGAVVRAVKRGETVTVTHHGKPMAQLFAVKQAKTGADGTLDDKIAVAKVEKFVAKVRKGRVRRGRP